MPYTLTIENQEPQEGLTFKEATEKAEEYCWFNYAQYDCVEARTSEGIYCEYIAKGEQKTIATIDYK
jgi:hypothetical protein